jgi:hypothetical protein
LKTLDKEYKKTGISNWSISSSSTLQAPFELLDANPFTPT